MKKILKFNHLFVNRSLCFILSWIMAFSTFITLTVSNAKLLDLIHIRNIITAYADDEMLPQFYREGELVGIYNPDYTSTDTIYYKIGENGTWSEYEVPVAIPAFTTTSVYAKIGENGTINGDDFTSSKLEVGVYYESEDDFLLTYNGLNFNYSRFYSSKRGAWFCSLDYHCTINGNIAKVQLPDSREFTFVKNGNDEFVNEIYGYTLQKENGVYYTEIEETRYYFGNNTKRITDKYGNEISYYSVNDLNGTSIYVSDNAINNSRRYIYRCPCDSYMLGADDEFGEDYWYMNIEMPNDSEIVYRRYDDTNTEVVVDQTGKYKNIYKYNCGNAYRLLTKSNDKTINYNSDGRVSSILYDSGQAITYTYDDANMTYIVSSNQGGSATTVYNDAFLPVSVSNGMTTTTYTYDSKYRLASETTDDITVTYSYDNNGNLVSSVSSDTENSINTYYTYYSNGKVKREQTGDDYIYYVYNANGDVTVSATLKENFTGTVPAEYDSTLTCFDVTEYTYDSSGRLTEEASDDYTESYTYDQYGNTASIESEYTENNETVTNQTDYTYDIMGNVLTSTQNNETTSYTYDEAGRTLLVNEDGKYTRTIYDSLGRVVQEIGPEDYDITKEGLPNENTYADANVGQRYHYNNLNQVDYEINRLDVRTDYTYHTNGVKATEAFDIYQYSYNNKGNVTQITLDGANTPYAVYTYDTAGTVLQNITYGNGQQVIYEYNTDGTIKKQKYKESANASPVTQFVYEYDSDGELTVTVDLNAQRYTAYANNTVTVSNLLSTEVDNEITYSAGALIYSYADTPGETTNGDTTPATSTKAYNGNTVGITYNENNTAYTLNNSSLLDRKSVV